MEPKKVRFGIIGTSKITEQFLKAAKKLDEFSFGAVYSRKEETAKEFASKYNVETIFTELEEMAKSDLIDAVYIASPNSFHYEQAKIFLCNKKHVFCEKPMASNSKEMSYMIELAKDNNVLLMEGMKTTLTPNFKILKDNIYYRNGDSEVISVNQIEENMVYEIEEFIQLINYNILESKINTYENSLNTSKIMEEIREQIGLIFPADLNMPN